MFNPKYGQYWLYDAPEVLQRSRILARVGVSRSVAGAVAHLAYGADRRDHAALLVDLTVHRTASAGAVAR